MTETRVSPNGVVISQWSALDDHLIALLLSSSSAKLSHNLIIPIHGSHLGGVERLREEEGMDDDDEEEGDHEFGHEMRLFEMRSQILPQYKSLLLLLTQQKMDDIYQDMFRKEFEIRKQMILSLCEDNNKNISPQILETYSVILKLKPFLPD
jgi:hypothetical protein